MCRREEGGGGGRGGEERKEEGGSEERKELVTYYIISQQFFVLTHLYVKPCLLEISNQWEAASDGVWLALTRHLLRSLCKLFEGI